MGDPNQTIAPSRGLRARTSNHFRAMKEKDNGSGAAKWVAAIAGGAVLCLIAAALLLFVERVPWYIGVAILFGGLQVGSRGLFGKMMLVLKDAAIEIMRAKKET